jgi:hypothetical protein
VIDEGADVVGELGGVLFDWLCVKGRENFLFNEECGRTNLRFIIDRCNMALS